MQANIEIPEILLREVDKLEAYYSVHYKDLASLVRQCFLNTMETTVKRLEDGGIHVITGDINAMWLRDSAAQVMHYVRFAKEDGKLQEILEGVIARQAELVCTDPYANAFNEKLDGSGHKDDTGTYYMHESFQPDDPYEYTRSWFAWANSLFAELLIRLMEEEFFERE